MRTALLLIALNLLAASVGFAECKDSVAGGWAGTITFRDEPLRFELDVAASMPLQARAHLPMLLRYDQALSLTCESDRWHLALPFGLGLAELSIRGDELMGATEEGATVSLQRAKPRQVRRLELAVAQLGGEPVMGTLMRPTEAGPVPLVLILAGSRNPVRDNDAYAGWAHWFARRGFAALIYDRPPDSMEINGQLLTIGDHADLVIEILDILSDHRDVDFQRIGLFGRSRGVWIAFEAASRDSRIRWLAGSGGSAMGVLDQDLVALRTALDDAELNDGQRARALAIQDLYVRTAHNPALWPRLTENLESLEAAVADHVHQPEDLDDMRWFAAHANHQPAETIAALDLPVFLAWGENDRVTPAARNRALFEALLSKKSKTTLPVYADAGHGLEGPINTDDDSEVVWSGTNQEFLLDLERWLDKWIGHP